MLVAHYMKPQGYRPPAEKVGFFDHLATRATGPRIVKAGGGDFMEARETVGLGAAPCEQDELEYQ